RQSRRRLRDACAGARREIPGRHARHRRRLRRDARLLGADDLQRVAQASGARREGRGGGARLRRPRADRHLGPAGARREEHRRLRHRRREARRCRQAGREADGEHARAGCGGPAARHRRRARFRRQPGDRRARHRRAAQRRPLHHLRPVWRRAGASAAADRATGDRHHRLVRRQPAGAEGGRRAGGERGAEADAGEDTARVRGKRRTGISQVWTFGLPMSSRLRNGGRMNDRSKMAELEPKAGEASTPFSWPNPYAWPRKPLLAENAVATSQPLAAQAGLQMLAAGGSAVDAILATAITLTLVEPVSNGIGSDAYAIVWDGRRLHSLNASGRSPQAWTLDYFRGKYKSMPVRGWDTVTVPGCVAAWAELHARWGKLA